VRIVKELMEIWPNEVCGNIFFSFWTYYSRIENVGKYHMTKLICYSHKHVMSHKVVTMMTIGK